MIMQIWYIILVRGLIWGVRVATNASLNPQTPVDKWGNPQEFPAVGAEEEERIQLSQQRKVSVVDR